MVQMSGFSHPNNHGAGGGDDKRPNKRSNQGSHPDLQEKLRRRHQKRAMSRASSSSNSQNASPVPRLDEGHHGVARGQQQVSHLKLPSRREHNITPDMSLNDPDGNGNFMFYDGEQDCPTPPRSSKGVGQGQGHVNSVKGKGHGALGNVSKPDDEDSALNTVLGEIQNNKLRKNKRPTEESGAVFQNNFDAVELQPVSGIPDRMRPHLRQQHAPNRLQGRGQYRGIRQLEEDEDGDDEDTEPEDHTCRRQGHNDAKGNDLVKQMMGDGQNHQPANNGGHFGMEPNVADDPLRELFRGPQNDMGDPERVLAGMNANNDPLAVLIGGPIGGLGGPIGGPIGGLDGPIGGPIGGLGGPIGGPIGGLGGPIGGFIGPIGGPIGGLGGPIGGLGGPIGGPIGGLGGPIGGPIGGIGALLRGGGGPIGGVNEEFNDNDNPFRQMFEGDGDNSFDAFFRRMKDDGHNAQRNAQQRHNQLLGQQISQGNDMFPGLYGSGDNHDDGMFDRMEPEAENDDEKANQLPKGHGMKQVHRRLGGWESLWDPDDNPVVSDDDNAADDPLAFLSPLGRNGNGRLQAPYNGEGHRKEDENKPRHHVHQEDPSRNPLHALLGGSNDNANEGGEGLVQRTLQAMNGGMPGGDGQQADPSQLMKNLMGSGQGSVPRRAGPRPVGMEFIGPNLRPRGQMVPSVIGSGPAAEGPALSSQKGADQMAPDVQGGDSIVTDYVVPSQREPGQMMPSQREPGQMMPSQREPGQMMPSQREPGQMMPSVMGTGPVGQDASVYSQRGSRQMMPSVMGTGPVGQDASVYSQRGSRQMMPRVMGTRPMASAAVVPSQRGPGQMIPSPMGQGQRATGVMRADMGSSQMGAGQMENLPGDNIDPDNCSEQDVIHQLLELERMRAESNTAPRANQALHTIIIVDASGSMEGEPFIEAGRFISQFISGLEELQFEYNQQENVALVCVGSSIQVVQQFTNNYSLIRDAADTMLTGGPSKLHFGLLLPSILLNHGSNDGRQGMGGVYTVGPHSAQPRVILISDGYLTTTDDQPGQVPQVDDQLSLALQNLCFNLVQSTAEQTLMKINCVPIGTNVNINFLEMLSQSTGGRVVQPTEAGYLSRSVLHHVLVAMLKQDSEEEPNRDTVIKTLQQVTATADDVDVNGIFEVYREGEPDLAARDQRMVAKAMEQQQALMQGGKGAAFGQGMSVRPGGGSMVGGGMGGGAGMTLPAMAAMLGGQSDPGRGGNAGGGLGGGAGMSPAMAAMLGGQADPGRGGNAGGGLGGGAGMLPAMAAMLGGQADPGRGGNAGGGLGGGAGMLPAMAAMLGGQADPGRGGNAGGGLGEEAGMNLPALAAMLGGQADPGREGNAGGGMYGGAGMMLPAMLGGQADPGRGGNAGGGMYGGAGMMLPAMLGGQGDPGRGGNDLDNRGNGGVDRGAGLVLPGLAALLEDQGLGREGNANEPEDVALGGQWNGHGNQGENSNFGLARMIGNKNELNNERQSMPGSGQSTHGLPDGLAELMRLNVEQDPSGLKQLSGMKGEGAAPRNGSDALFGRLKKPDGERQRSYSDYDVMFSGFDRDRELHGNGGQERGGLTPEAELQARLQGVGNNHGASPLQVESMKGGNGQLGLNESMFQASASPRPLGAPAALHARAGQGSMGGNMENQNIGNRQQNLDDLQRQMAAMRASDNNRERDMVQGGFQGMNGGGLVLGNPHQVQRRMQQMRLIQQQQRRQNEMYQPIQGGREPVFQGGNPNQQDDIGGVLRQQPYNGGGQGMPDGLFQQGHQVAGQYYNRQSPQGGDGGNPGQ